MKKIILSIITILTISIGLNAQIVNIPDILFKTYLINTGIDTNGDHEIQVNEAVAHTGVIVCYSLGISDLTGIEAFVNITQLQCNDNNLTSLDVSANTSLTLLYAQYNNLTSLDVSNNLLLESLSYGANSIPFVDISNNTAITELYVYDNPLTSLNLSNNTNLGLLWAYEASLTTLDLTANTNLYELQLQDNALTSLNVANGSNTFIGTDFNATGNPNLTCIQVDDVTWSTANWTNIDAASSFSTSCAAPACTVNIPDANFKNYLVGNTSINTNGDTEIQCSEASGFTGTISCSNSNISDLTGIESFTAITKLYCMDNLISTLDITQNTSLTHFNCAGNALIDVDVSQNTALKVLGIGNNSFTSIDVSQNLDLEEFLYHSNDITSLDLSENTVLNSFQANLNMLSSLNIANGNNANFTYFNVENNPNLTCVKVDNAVYSSTNWTSKDAQTNFNENCSSSVGINDLAFENLSVYPNPTNGIVNLNISETLSSIRIMDLTGKTIQVFNAEERQLDISNFTAGIYFLEIANVERMSVVKIVKR